MRHDTHFDVDTPDETWLHEVATRGWVAITRDARIRYSPIALAALRDSGAKLFVLVGKLTTEEAVDVFLRLREQISSRATREPGPFIAKIRRDGVYVWLKPPRRRGRRR